MAGRMHELLASETNVKAVYNAMLEESLKVFDTPAHFAKTVESIVHFDTTESHLDTTKTKEIVTTVSDRLRYFFGRPFVNAIDLTLQKDLTNQSSTSDLVVNGTTVATGVPAVTLLTWEGQFEALRALLLKVPTLQAGPVWVEDESQDLWRTADPVTTFLTKKVMVPVVLVAATKEHPAQVDKVFEDQPVAKKQVTAWSGMWTSRQKADALARLDSLIIATKKARQRANRAKVVQSHVAAKLANFILQGPEADALTGDDSPAEE